MVFTERHSRSAYMTEISPGPGRHSMATLSYWDALNSLCFVLWLKKTLLAQNITDNGDCSQNIRRAKNILRSWRERRHVVFIESHQIIITSHVRWQQAFPYLWLLVKFSMALLLGTTIVWGRPTFNTPAPLLQELGLNTFTTAVLRQRQLYYGNDSCITATTAVLRKRQLYYGKRQLYYRKPYSQSWKLLLIHIQQC